MAKRTFTREFKLEAVKLVKDRGVSVAQASRDLDIHVNVLRKWIRDVEADPAQAERGPELGIGPRPGRLIVVDNGLDRGGRRPGGVGGRRGEGPQKGLGIVKHHLPQP